MTRLKSLNINDQSVEHYWHHNERRQSVLELHAKLHPDDRKEWDFQVDRMQLTCWYGVIVRQIKYRYDFYITHDLLKCGCIFLLSHGPSWYVPKTGPLVFVVEHLGDTN